MPTSTKKARTTSPSPPALGSLKPLASARRDAAEYHRRRRVRSLACPRLRLAAKVKLYATPELARSLEDLLDRKLAMPKEMRRAAVESQPVKAPKPKARPKKVTVKRALAKKWPAVAKELRRK